jgi:hypothetical protein
MDVTNKASHYIDQKKNKGSQSANLKYQKMDEMEITQVFF